MTNEKFDSRHETLKHIDAVRNFLGQIILALYERGNMHDASKLEEPEKSMLDQFTPLLRGTKFLSKEYYQRLKDMGPALEHHYQNNSHHPEHFEITNQEEFDEIMKRVEILESVNPNDPIVFWLTDYAQQKRSSVGNMSLIDITEMLADWRAATLRHADGDIMQSLLLNKGRFGLSDQLFEIFVNTAIELGWAKA